ncbi:MAG: MFS transporter [Ignavibacteriales bacterium]|nr:MFS transporter [Ignavibacteriales bacterium]
MTTSQQSPTRNPWLWVPSLYLAEGIPYALVMTVSVIMYKKMGIPNDEIAFYTSWLYLPWVIKPLWSPVVDILRTKRLWIITTQLLVGAGLAGVALTLPLSGFFQWTIAIFWLIAFSSATHDIAADGFYILGLNEKQQAFFVGIRSTFYRIAMISAQGLLVMLAGFFETTSMFGLSGSIPIAWSMTFFILAGLLIIFFAYHKFILPHPMTDQAKVTGSEVAGFFKEFLMTFVAFFKKENIGPILAFLLLYRLGEAQLVKLASPFMLDAREAGGLALTTTDVGFIYGTVGISALTIGGLLGGIAAARKGFKFWLWPMVLAINIPDLVYVYLAYVQPDNYFIINLCVAFEQFGYGFGFTAYSLFMLYVAQGKHSTAHFALCTGFMALGMMIPGMFSGDIQKWLGYQNFFIWVCIATIPGFVVAKLAKVDPEFGKKAA